MNIDDIFDKFDKQPIGFIVGMWILGGLMSLVGLVVAIGVIVGALHLFGVL